MAELKNPPEITVLATSKAEEINGIALRDALCTGNYPTPKFVRIPEGRNSGELWCQFNIIKDELRNSHGDVILDITNGLRSQPFFASAVTAFIRAVDVNPPNLSVCYGAFEMQDENGIVPIWDLTDFITLLDWSRSLGMFLRTGRGKEAGAATEHLGIELRKTWADTDRTGPQPNLTELGKALIQFSGDLDTLRTGDLLLGSGKTKSSALRLLEAANNAKQQVHLHAPPLADILAQISDIVTPLTNVSGDLSGKDGREAVASLAKTYIGFERYLEAMATVREGYINFYAPKVALCPGSPNFDPNQRGVSEERAKKDPLKSVKQDQVFQTIGNIRNDLAHAQYKNKESTQSGISLIKSIEKQVKEFESASRTAAGSCFINLSNHSTAQWDEAQMREARNLAERVEDLKFPDVPPDGDETVINDIADNCIANIPRETTHALVQGEFTLTFELVRRLQARSVTCLAATTTRNVEEEAHGRKVSSFKFVRFRTYPKVAPAEYHQNPLK